MAKHTVTKGVRTQSPTAPRARSLSPQERFRYEQARKATLCPVLAEVQGDSTEFRLLEAVLMIFPTVKAPAGMNRTKAAINVALKKLKGADIRNVKGRNHGKHLIYRSLAWAYDELKKPAPQAPTADEASQPQHVAA